MSCGGSSATNRNAQAIRDATRRHPGAVTTAQARALFHRLTDTARAELTASDPHAHAESDDHGGARLTQEAHAFARARLDGELAAIEAVHHANAANTDVLAADAAAWVAQDPALAEVLTPARAAADVRRARRDHVVERFSDAVGGEWPGDPASDTTDPGPVDPGYGDGVGVLANTAGRRAWSARSAPERDAWTRAEARLHRVAKLQAAYGQAQAAGSEEYDQTVDHTQAYGPGLQARWDALPAPERAVMALRHGHPDGTRGIGGPLDPTETARRLGVDRETVRRLEAKARRRLTEE